MAKPKPKENSPLRAPKARRTLGLSVPPALRMPHQDLIKPLVEATYRSAESAAPAKNDALGLQSAAPAISAAPADSADPTTQLSNMWAGIPEVTRYVKVLHGITDYLCRMLEPTEQVLYAQLYRLSWGFGKPTCFISMANLAARANVGERTAHTAMKKLTAKGLVVKKRHIFGKVTEQGTEFELPLPIKLAALLRSAESAAPAKSADNKEHRIKDTHTNTETGVRVCSRFTLQECRRYAESLRTDGINNPGGYATKIHRSGEADELIAKFLAPVESAKIIDVRECPDCAGTGWRHPNGVGGGVVKCKHEHLVERLENHP